MGIKLHRIFPNHYAMLKNIQPFIGKLKSVFIAITFYSVGENVMLFLVMANVYIYIYIYIQGVPGGKDLTSGECSLGQTIPI
jgi:hypothetical protein